SPPPRYLHSFPTRRSSDLLFHRLAAERGDSSIGQNTLLENCCVKGKLTHGVPRGTDASEIGAVLGRMLSERPCRGCGQTPLVTRSEEHTSELQSRENLVCR